MRIFFVHHVTWSVNSVCHYFGTHRFATEDRSTNVFWLACRHWVSPGTTTTMPSHAAVHGMRRREIGPSAWIIGALGEVGPAGTWCAFHLSARLNALHKKFRATHENPWFWAYSSKWPE
ncbi:MAG TPA: hypothetical protein VJQ84_06070 [Solirubrobacterales bacterium]|nr:hypothetical protein [Solirubrobacterales bacterium]